MNPEERKADPSIETSWGQRLLLLVFGLLLLAAFEFGLRALGLGGRPPLLLELEAPAQPGSPGIYELNPRVAAPFFDRKGSGGQAMVGGHRREVVALPKPEGMIRVLMLGASTVEGFPLPRNLTTASFLELMLGEASPGREVEVINLGITAIASFPLQEIGRLAIEQLEPDLVIVYYGHNEFFGASGVASHRFLSRSSMSLALRQGLRDSAFAGLMRLFEPSRSESSKGEQEHLIEVMASATAIEPRGELHRAAGKTLRAHLSSLIEAAGSLDTPILLSTVVSLERDLAPIASFEPEDRAPGEALASFDQAWSDAGSDAEAILGRVDTLSKAHPLHAGLAYRRARWLERLGDQSTATHGFRQARDLDAMPWRASSDKNEVITDLAQATGTALADPAKRFAERAGGATGWSLFYDHVHPSLEGQFVLASTFLHAISSHSLLPLDPGAAHSTGDWRRIAGKLGAHPLERYLVLHKMATLFRTPPIGLNNEEAAERFEALLARQKEAADAIDLAAISLWEATSREAGFALPISFFAGRVALDAGDAARASVYLLAAIANAYELSDERVAARVLLAEAYLRSGDPRRARRVLEEASEEAERVGRLPGQPSALLSRAQAAIATLAGKPDARSAWREAEALEKHAEPWTRSFYEQIPDHGQLEVLLSSQEPDSVVP